MKYDNSQEICAVVAAHVYTTLSLCNFYTATSWVI